MGKNAKYEKKVVKEEEVDIYKLFGWEKSNGKIEEIKCGDFIINMVPIKRDKNIKNYKDINSLQNQYLQLYRSYKICPEFSVSAFFANFLMLVFPAIQYIFNFKKEKAYIEKYNANITARLKQIEFEVKQYFN